MTTFEFNLHYKKLSDLYPAQFGSKEKANAIAREVSGLSALWWQKLVDKVVAANDPFVKLMPLIDGEKRRLASEYTTSEQSKDYEQMKLNSSGRSLDSLMKQHGVTRAVDLIGKVK